MNHYRATAIREEFIDVNLEIGWARRGSMGSSGILFEYDWGRIFVNYADSVFNSNDSEKIEIGAEFY